MSWRPITLPCPPEIKQSDDFFRVWGGIAGVQWTLAGADATAASLREPVLCTSPPGLARGDFRHRKQGRNRRGFDADLTLIDLGRQSNCHA